MAHQFIEPPARALSDADNRLFLEIRRVLWKHEPLRATRAPLTVDVEGGRVQLGGRTRTDALRLIAAYLVSFVRGVTEVDNAIVSDDQVIRAVADALASNPMTAPHVLQVNARYGEVMLCGEVPSEQAETRAVELAREVPTVTAVRSDVSIVRPRRQEAAVGSAPTA